jgi:hypothetical protein
MLLMTARFEICLNFLFRRLIPFSYWRYLALFIFNLHQRIFYLALISCMFNYYRCHFKICALIKSFDFLFIRIVEWQGHMYFLLHLIALLDELIYILLEQFLVSFLLNVILLSHRLLFAIFNKSWNILHWKFTLIWLHESVLFEFLLKNIDIVVNKFLVFNLLLLIFILVFLE